MNHAALRCGFFAFILAEFQRLLARMSNSRSNIDPAATTIAPAEPEVECCADQARRTLLLGALASTACLAGARRALADDDQPGADERPQKGDVLVLSEGENEGQLVKPADLKLGGPPVRAWPKDPKTSVVRKGSRLNEVLVVKLDANELDETTRARAADGVVAYSAVCAHAACPVTEWVKADQGGDVTVFKCPCHNSEYDPRQSAQVVFGPAPRRLAALPLALNDGSLTVAAPFVGKVGGSQPG